MNAFKRSNVEMAPNNSFKPIWIQKNSRESEMMDDFQVFENISND